MAVGQTKDAGWQIGVSRTLDVPADALWDWLAGPGAAVWLGEGAVLAKGERYVTADGTTGEVRSYRTGNRIRLTWRPPGWEHDTTVQVAIQARGERTLLRFHQERLADAAERERQRLHWAAVMDRVEGLTAR